MTVQLSWLRTCTVVVGLLVEGTREVDGIIDGAVEGAIVGLILKVGDELGSKLAEGLFVGGEDSEGVEDGM